MLIWDDRSKNGDRCLLTHVSELYQDAVSPGLYGMSPWESGDRVTASGQSLNGRSPGYNGTEVSVRESNMFNASEDLKLQRGVTDEIKGKLTLRFSVLTQICHCSLEHALSPANFLWKWSTQLNNWKKNWKYRGKCCFIFPLQFSKFDSSFLTYLYP